MRPTEILRESDANLLKALSDQAVAQIPINSREAEHLVDQYKELRKIVSVSPFGSQGIAAETPIVESPDKDARLQPPRRKQGDGDGDGWPSLKKKLLGKLRSCGFPVDDFLDVFAKDRITTSETAEFARRISSTLPHSKNKYTEWHDRRNTSDQCRASKDEPLFICEQNKENGNKPWMICPVSFVIFLMGKNDPRLRNQGVT